MKRAIKAAWKGIQLSAVINLIMYIIIGLINGPEKFASGYGMARVGAAAVLIGTYSHGNRLSCDDGGFRAWRLAAGRKRLVCGAYNVGNRDSRSLRCLGRRLY